ncbi:hypothetical protein ACFLZB_00055 [Nanoarchaeota archaeon]
MNLVTAYTEMIKSDPTFLFAYEVMKRNSSGKIWLIGGALWRNMSHIINGGEKQDYDFDFLVEKPATDFHLPENWRVRPNKYGNPKFLGPTVDGSEIEVDCVPFHNVNSIIRRGLEASVENFLTGTPLTIQSMIYDVQEGTVTGPGGIHALQAKLMAVNDYEQAEIYASKKGISVAELVQKFAKSAGFMPIIPAERTANPR